MLRGITSAWPRVAGLMSMKEIVRSSSSTFVAGSSPATILQKMQSGSVAMRRRLPASLRRLMADLKPPSGTWRRSSAAPPPPGEREAAEWIAEQLRALGADAHTEAEQVHGGYWIPVGAPAAAARRPARCWRCAAAGSRASRRSSAARQRRPRSSTTSAAARRCSRRPLPKRESRNVVAVGRRPGRRPHARARGPPRRRTRRGGVRPHARRHDRGALAGLHRPVQDLPADHVADRRGPDPHRSGRADRLAPPAWRRRRRSAPERPPRWRTSPARRSPRRQRQPLGGRRAARASPRRSRLNP